MNLKKSFLLLNLPFIFIKPDSIKRLRSLLSVIKQLTTKKGFFRFVFIF